MPDVAVIEPPRWGDVAAALLARTPVLADKLRRVGIEDPAAGLVEVLRFLSLCAEARDPLTPSQTVDAAWHELVLCTRAYAELCEQHFGRFLHHEPGDDAPRHARQFAETLRRYQARFGVPDPRWWGEHPSWPTADCGGCEQP